MDAKKNLVVVIGGSGVDNLQGLDDAEWQYVETGIPGKETRFVMGGTGRIYYKIRPSDGLVFISRHGIPGERFGPNVTQYEGNIVAARMIADMQGYEYVTILATSACGSYVPPPSGLEAAIEGYEPIPMGSLVIPNDYMLDRDETPDLWGRGITMHANPKPPQPQALFDLAYGVAQEHAHRFSGGVHTGTYVSIEGNLFGTIAQAMRRKRDAVVVGMTAAQEALIALQLPNVHYLCVAAIPVDYDTDASHHGRTVPTMIEVSQADKMGAYMEDLIVRVRDDYDPQPLSAQCAGSLIIDRTSPDQPAEEIFKYHKIPVFRDDFGPRMIALWGQH